VQVIPPPHSQPNESEAHQEGGVRLRDGAESLEPTDSPFRVSACRHPHWRPRKLNSLNRVALYVAEWINETCQLWRTNFWEQGHWFDCYSILARLIAALASLIETNAANKTRPYFA
jgi:hypothetical protein